MADVDVLIVGGGTAGCVLASRLSESADRSVALIEAGPDYGPFDSGPWPDAIRYGTIAFGHHDWGYTTDVLGETQPVYRGKVMGGSSATNATGINMGLAIDYDGWEALGNPGWGFAKLLPYFQQVERLTNDDVPYRGRDGMLPVERILGESRYTRAWKHAAERAGIAPAADVSGPAASTGTGTATRNLHDGQRYSSAAAYLDPARHRLNLTILADATVDTILWEGDRAAGVRYRRDGAVHTLTADRVVLAAGAIGSPILLERSGIGDPNVLRPILGDAPIHPLVGVGRNLHDHYGTQLRFDPAPDIYRQLFPEPPPPGVPQRYSLFIRYKSDPALEAFDCDLGLSHFAGIPDTPEDGILICRIFLIQPKSEGSVHITSADPDDHPIIDLGYGVPEDIEAISRAVEWLRQVAQDPEVAPFIASEHLPGADVTGPALRAWVRGHLAMYHHPTGTCRMGPADESRSVVDAEGRVHGFANLYVADASIMPTIPRGMINLTVYALAEKIAADLAR